MAEEGYLPNMKIFYIAAIATGMLLCTACGNTEKTEAITADIEAAQMEGRNAAKEYATKQWRDTLELQRLLLETRARQSKYVIAGDTASARAFDEAFVSTLQTVRPDVARHLR